MALRLGQIAGGGSAREACAAMRGLRARAGGDVPGGAQRTDFDPLDPDILQDPYPAYARMLAGPPLHYSAKRRTWIITYHEHVKAALRANDTLSSAESVTPVRTSMPMLVTMDRPDHTRLRRVVAPYFTHEAVASRTEAIEEVIGAAVDALLAAPDPDVVAQVASPVPVDVIADVLAVPRADRPRFRAWSDGVVQGFGVRNPFIAGRVLAAALRLHAYITDTFEQRRREPGDDVLSHLVRSELSDEELYWFAVLLLVAGNETTTNLIGTMTLALARRPDQLELLREDPSLIPNAVEEALRHVAPIQGFYRTALRDYPVGDAHVPAGGRVLLLFGAANRDPRRYPEPDRFDVTRDASDHLAFGYGIHFCLGAHLARLEGAIYLRELTSRVERIDVTGRPEWNGNPTLRGLARLPVRLEPLRETARSPR
jgi:cytochrome P450